MDILTAAKKLTGVDWNLRGDILEQADDSSPRMPVPGMDKLGPLMESDAYIDKRKSQYPSIGDQLDAIWKCINTTPNLSGAEMLGKINAVKMKFPKPKDK